MSVRILMSILIPVLLFHSSTTTLLTQNYVKPLASKMVPCPNKQQRPCFTLKEYTNESEIYFVNYTTFYFSSGIHRLQDRLSLKNIHNLSFLGLPGNGIVNIDIDTLASITFEKSWNIEISSITFKLLNNFSFVMNFRYSHSVRLSNISILGAGFSGCSSISSQGSTLDINNSIFTGLLLEVPTHLLVIQQLLEEAFIYLQEVH